MNFRRDQSSKITIGVIGNCQARGVAESIRNLCPEAEVSTLTPHDAEAKSTGYAERQVQKLNASDILLYQSSLRAKVLGVDIISVAGNHSAAQAFPTIFSTSQFPDCHFLTDSDGTVISGFTGLCHSAIIAGSWLAGVPERRVPALFNAFTYSALGYLKPDMSREPARLEADRQGYDISEFLDGRRGRWMHTPHHPTISVLFEIAKQALAKCAIPQVPDAVPPEDKLSKAVVWPVYPGMGGSAMAELEPKSIQDVTFYAGRRLTLTQMINGSYRTYRNASNGIKSAPSSRMRDFLNEHLVASA